MDLLLETVTGPAGSVRVRAYPEGDALAVEVSVVGGPVVGTFALHDDDEALTGLLEIVGQAVGYEPERIPALATGGWDPSQFGAGGPEPHRSRPAQIVRQALPFVVTFDGGAFRAKGDTYPYRDLFREAGFMWDRERQGWWTKIPGNAARLRDYLDPAAVARIEQRNESIAASRMAGASCTTFPAPYGLQYLPYQCAGIGYALARESVLFGDEMGLGKTIQALGVINSDPSIQSVLCVVPASVRTNWKREAQKWLTRPFVVQVLEENEPIAPDTTFAIVNFEKLIARKVKGKEIQSAPFASAMARSWDAMILDEAHKAKNPKAKQTQAIVGAEDRGRLVAQGLVHRARRKMFLTGTPIPNRPIEAWPLVHALAPGEFNNWYKFAVRYANGHQTRFGFDDTGASNLGELQNRLRETIMVRRLKSEVLAELPPKRRQIIPLPYSIVAGMDPEEVSAEALEGAVAGLRAAVEAAHAAGNRAAYNTAVADLDSEVQIMFAKASKIRHDIAVRKVPFVVEHVESLLETVPKLVVMTHHHDVQNRLIAELGKALGPGAVVLHTGGLDNDTKQRAVDSFQNDPAVRVFVGSILASGVGITLTAASVMVFAELDWVPGNVSQAEDRIHRIGQHDSVLIQHLVVDGTIDAHMADVIVQKQEVADAALDIEAHEQILHAPVGLSVVRPPKTRAETWAAQTAQGLIAGTVSPVKQIRRWDGEFMERSVARLASQGGLLENDWRRLVAVVFSVMGGRRNELGALGEAAGREAQNAVEAWAQAAIYRLAALDPDQAAERNFAGFSASDSANGHTLANLMEIGGATDRHWDLAVAIAKHYPKQVGKPPKPEAAPIQNPRRRGFVSTHSRRRTR